MKYDYMLNKLIEKVDRLELDLLLLDIINDKER